MVKIQVNLLKTWHENGPINAADKVLYRQAIIRNPTEPIYMLMVVTARILP